MYQALLFLSEALEGESNLKDFGDLRSRGVDRLIQLSSLRRM